MIDNHSTDASFNILKQKLDSVKASLVRTERNLGYAGGNNIGIKYSTGEYILILNDDVIIDPKLISGLIKIAKNDNTIGIIGPIIYRYRSHDLWRYSSDFLYQNAEFVDVPLVVGAALMIKRETIQKIGLLDENFFLYNEEWDWCVRARNAGYRTVCAVRLRAWHKVPEDEEVLQYLPHRAYFFHRNLFLFAGKHCRNTRAALAFLFKHLIYYGNKSFPCYYVLGALRNNKKEALKSYLAALIDGISLFLKLRMIYSFEKNSIQHLC